MVTAIGVVAVVGIAMAVVTAVVAAIVIAVNTQTHNPAVPNPRALKVLNPKP